MSAADIAHALGDARTTEDVARTARALAIWHEARPAGVSIEIVGGSFTAIDIDGDARTTGYWRPSPQTSQRVLGTFDTLREPTRAFPERGGMR